MHKLKAVVVGISAGAALGLLATAASAQGNQPWQGFYLGIHGGYGWKSDDFHDRLGGTPGGTNVFIDGIDSRGWIFGGQAGYNWQRGSLVGGLEIDLSGTGIKGDSAPAVSDQGQGVTSTGVRSDDVKWLGSARARLGWAGWSNVLLYGTGGLAW